MTCRDLADFLLEYDEGALSPDIHAAFERHLTQCPNCAEYLHQYRETIKAGQRCFDDATPVEAPEELIQAILAARNRQ